MLEVKKDTHENVSIVLPGFNAETNLEARQLADECFSKNDEMLRYLLISSTRNNSNRPISKVEAQRRKKRPGKRRDFTVSGIYRHEMSGIEFKINNNESQGAFTGILDSAADQMYICFQKFGKRLLAIRVDLHMREPEPDNSIVSRFRKNLNRRIKTRFPRHKQLGYVWIAETGSKSKKKHYHLHLYINGNCARTSQFILPMITAAWEGQKTGNTVAPAAYYKYITQADQLKTAVYDMSYLAKSKDKGFQARNANDYSTSRIRLAA